MAKTPVSHRIFVLVVAVTFLLTTVGVSVALIWQLTHSNSDATTNSSATTQTSSSGNKLEGTKMQNFTPVAKVDSLQVTDLKAGTGQAVTATDTVTVDYTGAVAATGVIFQSSLDSGQTATFALSGVIPGWEQGMIGMKVGGERRLLIPAALAYGANPPANSGIPANADLVFDITLHSISN